MKNFNKRTIVILAVFAALFLITQWVFIPGTYSQSRLMQALQAPKVLLQALRSRHSVVADLSVLVMENQSLRGQLAEQGSLPSLIKEAGETYIYARVYSNYPFNNSDRLLINAGIEQGIAPGDVVMVKPGIFLGEVTAVNKNTSEVRTLYDQGLKIPVKIGEGKIDALLIGGHEVKLTLISKKKSAQSGQTVLTAAKQYPYGLLLGMTKDLRDSADNLFQEATLQAPYSVSDLNDVYVLK